MIQASILLFEDDANDAQLTPRALHQRDIAKQFVAIRDGAAALDYLSGVGKYAGRGTATLPQLILLDLQLPRPGMYRMLLNVVPPQGR